MTANAPGVLAQELLALYERDGAITPEAVLTEARDPASPLHHRFEWDDSAAAEAHRRSQAQNLIREVKIQVVTTPDLPPVFVRAFVHIPHDDTPTTDATITDTEVEPAGAYYPYAVVASSQVLSRLALREMERRWRALRRSYENHAEFWALIQKDLPPTPLGETG